jgi:hypothetical protein
VKRASWFLLLLSCALTAGAVERKALRDVDVSAMTRQLLTLKQGEGLMATVWWPPEFYAIALERDPEIPDDVRKRLREQMSRHHLFGVVNARVLADGTFAFESREAVLQNSTFDWSGPKGQQRLVPMKSVPEEMRPLIESLEPMMRAALGELGKNLHVLVVADDAAAGRFMSPYDAGSLTIVMSSGAGGIKETMRIETPIDALFAPRLCPGGKPAHVTWKFCPWDGSKLPD